MSSTLESKEISLQDANDLLKEGYPPIPESVRKYLEYRHDERKERDVFPAILSEYPVKKSEMSTDKAQAVADQALAVRASELEGQFQGVRRQKRTDGAGKRACGVSRSSGRLSGQVSVPQGTQAPVVQFPRLLETRANGSQRHERLVGRGKSEPIERLQARITRAASGTGHAEGDHRRSPEKVRHLGTRHAEWHNASGGSVPRPGQVHHQRAPPNDWLVHRRVHQ